MSGFTFWRDKLFFAIVILLTASFSVVVLWALNCPVTIIILISGLYLLGGAIAVFKEYAVKSAYYRNLYTLLDSLSEKHYIAEIAATPEFWESKILTDVLQIAGKSMNDAIAENQKDNRDYREYIEMWVHEIKTPISGAKLICENKGYEDVDAELTKIERYVEQALFYARSGAVEKDYVIKNVELDKIIRSLIKENAKTLIARKIRIDIQADGAVSADPKWLTFILQQLLDNSVKYGANAIRFVFANGVLTVEDDGIGIPPADLPRVFERGFTGENGRGTAKSTGMGLYICKELCRKMGLEISARSDSGTAVSVTFPENPYVTFL
ncbi:MAG: HAMP domain-containing histidine kinase [Oscillospiraceae bacterium]|jgi:signal transduction histidine kinase|nr:HAMP domain-containing histidine kinase [Oscillospiraceae bacterium]